MKPYFLSHCDEADCGLGTFNYECPHCLVVQVDYNLWFEQDRVYAGEHVCGACPSCSKEIFVELQSLETWELAVWKKDW